MGRLRRTSGSLLPPTKGALMDGAAPLAVNWWPQTRQRGDRSLTRVPQEGQTFVGVVRGFSEVMETVGLYQGGGQADAWDDYKIFYRDTYVCTSTYHDNILWPF